MAFWNLQEFYSWGRFWFLWFDFHQEAAKARAVGTKSLETAQKMQLDIAKQANELESNVLLLQEKERQIAAVGFPEFIIQNFTSL